MQEPDNWNEFNDEEKMDFMMSRSDTPAPASEIPGRLALWAVGNAIYWFFKIASWLNGFY